MKGDIFTAPEMMTTQVCAPKSDSIISQKPPNFLEGTNYQSTLKKQCTAWIFFYLLKELKSQKLSQKTCSSEVFARELFSSSNNTNFKAVIIPASSRKPTRSKNFPTHFTRWYHPDTESTQRPLGGKPTSEEHSSGTQEQKLLTKVSANHRQLTYHLVRFTPGIQAG